MTETNSELDSYLEPPGGSAQLTPKRRNEELDTVLGFKKIKRKLRDS